MMLQAVIKSCSLLLLFLSTTTATVTTPVFGILTQPIHGKNETMIAASYVKWLEAGGARSIPIPFDASQELVEDIFSQIDGVLFPGGGSDLPPAAEYIWTLVNAAHRLGDAIPLWGTCLGFEFLVQLGAQDTSIMATGFDAENISLPLEQVEPYLLYKPKHILEAVRSKNITMNNHHQGISPEQFEATPSLSNRWRVTSVNHDRKGQMFVSTIEPNDPSNFPVYGVQYHPEKNAFEYATYPHTDIPYEVIDHSPAGITMSLYMAGFAVKLARHNPVFGKFHEYTKPDRYPLVLSYPMSRGVAFEESFRIPPASHWEKQSSRVSVSREAAERSNT